MTIVLRLWNLFLGAFIQLLGYILIQVNPDIQIKRDNSQLLITIRIIDEDSKAGFDQLNENKNTFIFLLTLITS